MLAPLAWLRAFRRAGAVAPAGPLRGPVPLISRTLGRAGVGPGAMTGRRTGIAVEGAAARAGLARVAEVLESPRDAMDEIGRRLVSAALRRFESERGPDGRPWLRSARALTEGGRTLTDSGRLRASIAHSVAADGRAVLVGSDVAYAAIHQFGSRAGGARRRGGGTGRRGQLPARPYLGIDESDRDAIRRILARAIARASEGAASALPRASGAT